MNAITLLRADHKTVKALFKQFEQLGENAKSEKKRIVERIIKELAVHAAIEEQVLYPAARKAVPDGEENVLEALEEHHIVKWTLSELEKMSPDAERFDAKVSVLIENVRHHIEEEEGELFPKIREALGRKDLEALGASLEAAKKTAPTHPHPRAPDTPPGNLVAGPGAALVDRVADGVVEAGKAIAKKVRSASKSAPKRGKKASASRARA
jgi:hemerythrin superfamily protein